MQLGPAATLQLQGSILQLRGRKPASNPVKDNLRNILVFNGTNFAKCKSLEVQVACCPNCFTVRLTSSLATPPLPGHTAGEIFGGLSVPAGGNDTQALLQALTQDSVQEVFNTLRGPWAAVYWQHSSRTLWFGKDVLGIPLSHGICTGKNH